MIPASVIEDLKYRNRIDDVISSYVTLSRSGSNLKGLCPFHSEKTPSFTVFADHFYCFGCGAGGDVISFVMRAENLDYPAALQFLADRSGVTLPDFGENQGERGVTRTRVLEINRMAAKFFHEKLYSPEGARGREYFERRQLSGATIKHFGLGWAPDSFNELLRHLKGAGCTDEELVASYLCQRSKKDAEHLYDCFRGRVMFPIIDTAGNVVAFGGRVLDDSTPKYLNSGDTPAFRKSRNLFALNFAKSNVDGGFILCEGYMDVIALHAAGFCNAVATLGTAITGEQARIMKRYTDKVTISYDSDEAGRKAADKAIRLLSEAGIDAKVLRITGAKDPDEYIKKYGADKFSSMLGESRSRFDYILDGIKERHDISIPDEKIKAAAEACRAISEVYSKVERDIYVERAAAELEISAQSIKLDIEAIIKKKSREAGKERRGVLLRDLSAIGDRVNHDFAKSPRCGKLEETVLGIMLYNAENIRIAAQKLTPDDFYTALGKRYFEFICGAQASGGFEFGMLGESFSEDEISRAAKMLTERRRLSSNGREALTEACNALKVQTASQRSRESGETDLAELISRLRNENDKQ